MLSTNELTAAERLLIDRRRAGATQVDAAAHWGVSAWTYRMWESGQREKDIPEPTLGRLTEVEGCVILRRRTGLSRTALAKLVSISEWWLTQMERGRIPADRLIEFWRNR